MRLLVGLPDQHYVGFSMAADDGELFPVEGVVEIANELGLEVSELFTGRAIQML